MVLQVTALFDYNCYYIMSQFPSADEGSSENRCRPGSNQSAMQYDQRPIVDAERRSQVGAPLDSCRMATRRQ